MSRDSFDHALGDAARQARQVDLEVVLVKVRLTNLEALAAEGNALVAGVLAHVWQRLLRVPGLTAVTRTEDDAFLCFGVVTAVDGERRARWLARTCRAKLQDDVTVRGRRVSISCTLGLARGRSLSPEQLVTEVDEATLPLAKGSTDPEGVTTPAGHAVLLHHTDNELFGALQALARNGLALDGHLVLITARRHSADVLARLPERALRSAWSEARLSVVDVDEVVDQLLEGETVDAIRFDDVLGALLRSHVTGRTRLSVCSQLSDALWQRGALQAALTAEDLWNDLMREIPFELACTHRLDAPGDGLPGWGPLGAVCGRHSLVRMTQSVLDETRRQLDGLVLHAMGVPPAVPPQRRP